MHVGEDCAYKLLAVLETNAYSCSLVHACRKPLPSLEKSTLQPNSNSSPKWPSDTVSQNVKIQASTEEVPGEIRN